jgi:hypothetical protein
VVRLRKGAGCRAPDSELISMLITITIMNTIKLEKGIVHLMLPFRLGSGWSLHTTSIEDELWAKTDEDIHKLDFLLEHVKEFFSKNYRNKTDDKSASIIMRLKNEALPVKMFNNKKYWLSNKPFNKEIKSAKLFMVPVFIDPNSFRIICHPLTSVAVLLFSIELIGSGNNEDRANLADLIRLNYNLRLFNRHDEAYFITQNERPEERKKALLLLPGETRDISEKTDILNIEHSGWRPGQLITYLLSGLNNRYKVEFFNHFHFTPVTYLQPVDEITDDDIIHKILFYLRKVYDFDYTPAAGILQSKQEKLNPYKQVFYAASLEGAVVLNNPGSSDPEFIKTFYSGSFQKTYWLAILGFLQRSIFLQLMKELSDIDPDDHHLVKEYLSRYTTISLKALFSKVSIYHQHNDFYDLIIHNFQINELQTELKDELYGLNNLQRQFHEDEVEKHELLEKQYDKKLNVILFALSVFSLTQVTYTVMGNKSLTLIQHLLALGIPVMLGLLFWQILSFKKPR